MDTDKPLKRKFLAVYDYGTGGAWYVISARSKEEIVSKFPKLKVFDYDKPPSALTKETLEFIVADKVYDIDDRPEGSLAGMVKQ